MPVNQSLETGGPAAGGEALGYIYDSSARPQTVLVYKPGQASGERLEASWKHLGSIWEASTVGFPP